MNLLTRRDGRAARRPRRGVALLCVALVLAWTATASAQLDPLLFLKRVPPTVIVVVDTSLRMLEDGNGNFYDPNEYTVASDPVVATALGVGTATRYRRIYRNLLYENIQDNNSKFEAETIAAVPDTVAGYSSFLDATRFEIAKAGISRAVSENAGSNFRWSLIKLRQSSPKWRVSPNCDKPVRVTGNAALALVNDGNPCNVGGSGRFGIYPPEVAASNFSLEGVLTGSSRMGLAAVNTAQQVLAKLPDLVPAGNGARGYQDRPITHALEDARATAIAAMDADSDANRVCRNTVVVLVTGGKDDGDASYVSTHSAPGVASTFMNVTSKGTTKRVPIHVVAIRTSASDEAQLQNIASNSGGRYVPVTTAGEVAHAIHHAVQAGFARSTDFDSGTRSEFSAVSPIVGTVNLKDGRAATGGSLPNTDITSSPGNQPLPQRSNFLLTAGFSLPGFDGVLRAFRVYRPEPDSTKPTGWKFVNDGTPLWPDIDGRPSLAGQARVPKDPASRNVFTYIPNGFGGGSVVAFTATNETILRPHMNVTGSAADLIQFVRNQPLGAVIGSTPAIMDVPSLDPPPDDAYGYADSAGSFAGRYKNRRALIFFGGNNGMIHAVDARTGYEVWAFIPYNLLPKLSTLPDGQAVEQFDYFVDSSPKLAEVKIGAEWRSLLLIGQGPGGTFYQAFDVTEAGMGVAPDADGIGAVDALLQRFDQPDESIAFKWAFPNYSSFDPTYAATFIVTDGTPGGRVRIFGDLKASATAAEKTVGFTWSDPAVGPLDPPRGTTAVIVGSGYFPEIENSLPGRGAGAPRAGNALYLINADTGQLLGGSSSCTAIANGSGSGTGCVSIGDVNNSRKNALQADPTAAGEAGSHVVTKAYLGDVDGRYWRFNFNAAGTISANLMIDTAQPIYASSALLFIGSTQVFMFFATGSDLLPSTAPGGTGTFKLYGLRDDAPGAGASVRFSLDLATVTNVSGLATGERPSTSPSVAGDIVFYTTTIENGGAPCSDFTSKLYALTYAGGAAYDTNNNGRIDAAESPVVRTMAGRASAPFIVDQHLYVGTSGSSGANVEVFGDPQDFNNGVGQVGVRILSWREIR